MKVDGGYPWLQDPDKETKPSTFANFWLRLVIFVALVGSGFLFLVFRHPGDSSDVLWPIFQIMALICAPLALLGWVLSALFRR